MSGSGRAGAKPRMAVVPCLGAQVQTPQSLDTKEEGRERNGEKDINKREGEKKKRDTGNTRG